MDDSRILLGIINLIFWYINILIYLYTLWKDYYYVFISAFAVFVLLYILKRIGILYQLFHKVDILSNQHGGELVADVLKAHNVKFLFTLVGGHISPILVACEKIGIRVVDTRHEASAVFAADAVSRLSGSIGVAAVTAGPGVTNTVTAVKNAHLAESPVLILGGAAAALLKGRGSLQDIDQLPLFQSLCKHVATVKSVRDIVPVLRKAIKIAQSGTPGPVFVELPIDCLYPYSTVAKEFGMKTYSRSIGMMITNMYLRHYLRNMFSGAFEKRDLSPLPVDRPLVPRSKVQKCAEIISRAKKPLLLIGSQAMLPPTPSNELQEAVSALGIPCYLGSMARGLLGRNSPIQLIHNRKKALQEADVVILAGIVCDFRLSYGRVLNRRSKIIAVNRNKAQLLKNSDMFWSPKIAVVGDPGSFLVDLQRAISHFKCDQEWLNELKERDAVTDKEIRLKANEKPEIHLNPLRVLHEVEKVMAEDSIIVADGGDFVGSAAYILRPRGPLKWLDPGPFGTLGVGGGFALGAKLCCPESEVWIIYGDGSAGFSIAEYDSFVRHKTSVISIIGNDAGWTQISRDQIAILGRNTGCALEYTDYDIVGEGFGGKGFKIDRSSDNEIADILKEVKKKSKEGQSVVVNALIGRSNFREGSTSV